MINLMARRQEIAQLTDRLDMDGWILLSTVRVQGQRYQLTFRCQP